MEAAKFTRPRQSQPDDDDEPKDLVSSFGGVYYVGGAENTLNCLSLSSELVCT